MEENETKWMHLAIEEAEKCRPGTARVGAVIVKDATLLATGYRGETGPNIHAEQCMLDKLQSAGLQATGADVYTTLEPCSTLTGNRVPCAELLARASVSKVFIGAYDQNPAIYRKGWRMLKNAGILVRDFDANTRDMAKKLNSTFSDFFTSGTGLTGGARFDYSQNGGRFDIFLDESRDKSILTSWTNRGANTIYAYGGTPGRIALATYAEDFVEIDDPDSLDYESHALSVEQNEIVIFRNEHGHALIQVLQVDTSTDETGNRNNVLKIRWEVRPT